MRFTATIVSLMLAGTALGKLPPLSDVAQAQAAEVAAKGAWSDKIARYQTCLAMERTAISFRRGLMAAGKDVPAPVATPPCADPGPYVSQSTPVVKPLEAAGAHSPHDGGRR